MILFSNKFEGFKVRILKELNQDCFCENFHNKQRNGQLKIYNLTSENEVALNFNNQVSTLRGGGCISTNSVAPETKIRFNFQDSNFATNFKYYTNVIVEKASQFHDKYHKDDVLCALLWFQNHKEHIQKLCMNKEQNLQNYDLIEGQFENLIKQLVIYLKLSGYVFHVLLQICNDLLRVIFYFQQVNEDRYMKEDLKQSLKECILELEELKAILNKLIQFLFQPKRSWRKQVMILSNFGIQKLQEPNSQNWMGILIQLIKLQYLRTDYNQSPVLDLEQQGGNQQNFKVRRTDQRKISTFCLLLFIGCKISCCNSGWKLNTLSLIEKFIRISCYSIQEKLTFNDFGNQLISLQGNRVTKIQIVWDLKQNPLYETKRIISYKEILLINYYFSSDKQLLIKTNPLQIIDLQRRNESNQFPIDYSQSNSVEKFVAMSHNKLKLAIQNENEIILWSFKTQKVDYVFVNSIGCAQVLVFSSNDKILFTNYDAIIKCFDVTNQYQVIKEFQIVNPVEVNKLQYHQLKCYPVKNDDFLFVYSFIQPVKRALIILAFISDHEQSYTLYENDYGISNFLSAYCEERELLVLQLYYVFQLHDLRTKTKIANLNPNSFTIFNPNFLSFSKSGNYLLSLGNDKDINLCDLSCFEKIKLKLNNLNKINYQEIISTSFLDDQDSIQLVRKDEDVQFDSITNYNDFCQILLEEVSYEQLIKKTQHHIMPEDDNKILSIKSVINGELIYSFDKFRNQINCSTFTPCGQNLILGMNDGSILFFRLNNHLQPKCFKSLALGSPILSDSCSIKQSTFVNQENIKLTNLFFEKGAQDQ